MATTADIRNGLVINWNNSLYEIDSFQHVKPGKGGAFVRTRLRRLSDGAIQENTFRAGHSLDVVRLETREMEYLYSDGDLFYFMNSKTYDQVPLSKEQLGERIPYLKENMVVKVQVDEEERAITIELPPTVELKIVETDPGVRGDTVSGGSKPAKLETGIVVQVPLFVNEGTVVKVDTRSGAYLGRV
ncbi:MAG: elongation factor P [Candidatus Poribacteria bacterium]|nr:elongation factor P [Candidatus Poribacteria bacterium]